MICLSSPWVSGQWEPDPISPASRTFFFNPKYGPGPELCCVVTLSQVQAWLSFLARVQTESQNWGREGTSVLVRGMGFYIWPRLSRSDFSLRVTFPSSHSRLEAETGWTQTSWVSRAASFHFTVSLSPPHPLNCPPQVPSSRPRPEKFLTLSSPTSNYLPPWPGTGPPLRTRRARFATHWALSSSGFRSPSLCSPYHSMQGNIFKTICAQEKKSHTLIQSRNGGGEGWRRPSAQFPNSGRLFMISPLESL